MSRPLFFLSLLLLALTVSGHGGHHIGGTGDSDDDNEPSPAEHPNLRSTPLILAKVWCLIIIFVGTFIAGISPYFRKWDLGFLVLGTQFACGVFLGTALMHFLSDATATFGNLTEKEYPFAFMLACAGYLATMLSDSVILYVYGRRTSESRVDLELQGDTEQEKGSDSGTTSDSQNQVHNGPNAQFASFPLPTVSSLGDSILLIIGLCFHSVFEGITIGVKETVGDTWRGMWTVFLHKVFAAIAMGVALLRMTPERPLLSSVAYAFAFSISSPFGVAIGIVRDSTTQGPVADWIYAISMGLACGVFIYLSINHLLSKGSTPQKTVSVDTPHYKFLAVLLGVGVIAIVMIWDA